MSWLFFSPCFPSCSRSPNILIFTRASDIRIVDGYPFELTGQSGCYHGVLALRPNNPSLCLNGGSTDDTSITRRRRGGNHGRFKRQTGKLFSRADCEEFCLDLCHGQNVCSSVHARQFSRTRGGRIPRVCHEISMFLSSPPPQKKEKCLT